MEKQNLTRVDIKKQLKNMSKNELIHIIFKLTEVVELHTRISEELKKELKALKGEPNAPKS